MIPSSFYKVVGFFMWNVIDEYLGMVLLFLLTVSGVLWYIFITFKVWTWAYEIIKEI